MKIGIFSDPHLLHRPTAEQNQIADKLFQQTEGCDLILNAGDTHPHTDGRNWLKEEVLRDREGVEYFEVLGNHDSWYGHLQTTQYLTDQIVGATLWTDFGKGDPLTMHNYPEYMRDADYIDCDSVVELTNTIYNQHTIDKIHIEKNIRPIVVTHHLPSFASVPPRYRADHMTHWAWGNNYFASNMDEFILDHPEIKLWVHGHTHDACDYMIGGCRVICNPIGHPKENDLSKYQVKIVEMDL